MRWAVDAGRREVALAIVRRLSAFGDDQADAGALGVIFGGQFSRRAVELRTAAGVNDRFMAFSSRLGLLMKTS
jgi:hypothetical protein